MAKRGRKKKRANCPCGGSFSKFDHIVAKRRGKTCDGLLEKREKSIAWHKAFSKRVREANQG